MTKGYTKDSLTYVGQSVTRSDALSKVTGRAKYAADLEFPRMLHAKVVRIPCAHGIIKGINLKKALALKGVVAAVTAGELDTVAMDETWVPALVKERVRSYADAVAVVAAETEEIAIEAAKLVKVDYEELPPVFDVLEALKPEAVPIHGKSNFYKKYRIVKGDLKKGLGDAEVIIERTYTVPFAEHSYLETEAAIGVVQPEGGITVYGSFKAPFDVRRMVAKVLNFGLDKVRIIPITLGGYFGGKDEDMALMATRVALLALKTGRPVRIFNTREESILESTKRHRYVLTYTVGAKRNGELTGMNIHALADMGAYSVKSPIVTYRSSVEAAGPYKIPNVKIEVESVFTNNNNTGSFRGFGSPQVNFACESIMDELAEELGMDPFELRMLNALQDGDTTPSGQRLTGVSVKQCLQEAVSRVDWKTRTNKDQQGDIKRGIGVSASFRGISLGGTAVDTSSAIVSIQEDGRVLLSCAILDGGQGARTVLEQICADSLGLDLKDITTLDWDTSLAPDSGSTVASRGTFIGGNAVKDACSKLLEGIFSFLAVEYVLPEKELYIEKSIVKCKSNNNFSLSFKEAIAKCRSAKMNLCAVGFYKSPDTGIEFATGQGKPFFDYVYGANVAEVEVDTLTGKVNVVNFISAHDIGKAVNPQMLEGQICGGVCMGIGNALMEEYYIKGSYPGVLNFDQYLIPTSMDVAKVTAVMIENGFKEGPFGASSIGEPAYQIVAPAIINAIANATGKRIRDLPADLEKVFLGKAVEKKSKRSSEGVR